jgi:hypothetical protein
LVRNRRRARRDDTAHVSATSGAGGVHRQVAAEHARVVAHGIAAQRVVDDGARGGPACRVKRDVAV